MRLVSLAPSNTEILYKLGVEDLIAANTAYCDYPKESEEKPNIGGWLNIFTDKVMEEEPDAVLTSSFLQDNIKKRLEEKGIEVLHFDPKTLQDVYSSIEEIGDFVGEEEKSHRIVEGMKNEIAAIREEAKQLSNTPRVYCEEWHKPPNVSGNWVPELIEAAGGAQDLIEGGVPSRPVELEELQEFNPDVIILHWCGFGSNSDVSRLAERDGWENLDAVKKRKVFTVDDSLLNRPGPRLTQGCKKVYEIVSRLS